jgi:hypothetical protein
MLVQGAPKSKLPGAREDLNPALIILEVRIEKTKGQTNLQGMNACLKCEFLKFLKRIISDSGNIKKFRMGHF